MLRRLPLIFSACVMLCGPAGRATAEQPLAGTTKVTAQQNPLIDDVARNDPDGLRSLLLRLQVLTTAQRDSGPARSGSVPTTQELAQIDDNALLRQAYASDPAATLALLRATNEELLRARRREPVQAPKRLALVIGNSGDPTWGRLGTARNDANLVANALIRQGFALFQGHAWLDLDRSRMLRVIDDFSKSITPDTVVLVYYAGHGLRADGRNFLVPANAAMPRGNDDYDRNLVAVGDVLMRHLVQGNGRLNIVVLDACEDRAAALPGAGRGQPQGSTAGFAPMSPHGTGMIVISSTAPDDIALDSIGNAPDSPFASAFAEAIGEPGMEIRDVFARVETSVDRATNHQQQPWISYSSIDRFYFDAPASPAVRLPTVAVDDRPFRCPAAGTTVAFDVPGGTVTGTYQQTDPADPVVCRIVASTGETKALLYNFFDANALLSQTSIRAGMGDLLSKHVDSVEFEVPYSYTVSYEERWKRLGTEMLPVDGRYVRAIMFERKSHQSSGYIRTMPDDRWMLWYDPAAGVFVKSEHVSPGSKPALGTGNMPENFKVISLAPG